MYPEAEIPPPSCTDQVVLEGPRGESLDVSVEEIGALVSGPRLEIVPDGSCSRPGLVELERASWAIVVLQENSDEPAAVLRPVH